MALQSTAVKVQPVTGFDPPAAGAHGVHLKSQSFPARRARAIAPAGLLIGQSIHGAQEAATLGPSADYLLFGTVFETSSKPERGAAGCAALGEAVRATHLPVIAVGGVTPDNAAEVARAGAAGIAAIGLFAGDAVGIRAAVDRVVRAFDLPVPGS